MNSPPEPSRIEHVNTPDGRVLETLLEGAADGRLLVFHKGTPSGAVPFPLMARVAAERGLRLLSYSRPGYGESTARPGRTVADVASDVETLLEAFDAERFLTLGWSGGGPHALACGALLGDRCDGVAVLAGVAPLDAEGLNWLRGMGEENLQEFGAALAGEEILGAALEALREQFGDVEPAEVAEALGSLAPPVDREALTGEFAETLAASMRKAVLRGIEGWRDDDLAFVRPWGFDLADVTVPVAIWQGGEDRMVPYAHGKWLAEHLPHARKHLYDDEGHLSLVTQADRILDDLLDLGG